MDDYILVLGIICTYVYGKCLGFARNRNHDRQRIIIIITIIIIKSLLKIFNECKVKQGWENSTLIEDLQ